MALKFAARRQAKGLDPTTRRPAARSPRLVKCTWEAQHADDVLPALQRGRADLAHGARRGLRERR
jgi:hypothetical protein